MDYKRVGYAIGHAFAASAIGFGVTFLGGKKPHHITTPLFIGTILGGKVATYYATRAFSSSNEVKEWKALYLSGAASTAFGLAILAIFLKKRIFSPIYGPGLGLFVAGLNMTQFFGGYFQKQINPRLTSSFSPSLPTRLFDPNFHSVLTIDPWCHRFHAMVTKKITMEDAKKRLDPEGKAPKDLVPFFSYVFLDDYINWMKIARNDLLNSRKSDSLGLLTKEDIEASDANALQSISKLGLYYLLKDMVIDRCNNTIYSQSGTCELFTGALIQQKSDGQSKDWLTDLVDLIENIKELTPQETRMLTRALTGLEMLPDQNKNVASVFHGITGAAIDFTKASMAGSLERMNEIADLHS
ncbi:MAG: hypothetical protein HKM07_03945 [Chlamydiae bacterium]|nr:hypothetical protein [Chlamydiota bacterium]